jgi:hypothetical protein
MDNRPSLSKKAFLDAILGRGDPAKTAAFVAAITGKGKPIDTAAFAAAVTGKGNPIDTAAFAAAITCDDGYQPREIRDERDRPTRSITYTEWINTVKYGVPHPLTAAEFVAAITGETGFIPREPRNERYEPVGSRTHGDESSRDDPFASAALGEAGYNPEEPRDERGRWTTDGSRAGAVHTVSFGGPGTSGDPADDAARKKLDDERKKAQGQAKKGLDDLFKGADDAKKAPDAAKWRSTQTGDTGKNAKILRGNMEQKGIRFSEGEQPHHIVHDKYHVDINSAENGLKVTRRVHETSGFQKSEAIKAVTKRLEKAARSTKDWDAARRKVISELSNIKQAIASGKLPCP